MKLRPWRAESALTLAVLRITVPAVVLISPELWLAADLAELPAELRVIPEGLRAAASVVPITAGVARAAQGILAVACVAAILGICSRIACGVVTAAGLYVFALSQFSGSVLHDMHLFWFSALLAASPCGDALSVDRYLRKRRGEPPKAASSVYGLPLQCVRVLLGVVYFFPGLWKLLSAGLEWIWSDNLRNQLYWKWYQMGGITPAWRIDRLPTLLKLGGLSVVLFELSFIALIWSRRTRLLAAGLGLAFHTFMQVFLYIPFLSLWACYTALVDWERLPRFRRPPATSPAIQPPSAAEPRIRTLGPSLVLGALLIVANVVQGARGAMQAWPFACYPTFQWTVGDTIPDLRLEAVGPTGTAVAIPDAPGTGGTRSQQGWSMAWQVAGLYGTPPTAAELRAYWDTLSRDPRVRAAASGATSLRFYLAHYSVVPERFGAAPMRKHLLAEIALRD